MAVVLVISLTIGPAMVALRAHYMTDVVAGVPLGFAVAGCTAALTDALAGLWARRRGGPTPLRKAGLCERFRCRSSCNNHRGPVSDCFESEVGADPGDEHRRSGERSERYGMNG